MKRTQSMVWCLALAAVVACNGGGHDSDFSRPTELTNWTPGSVEMTARATEEIQRTAPTASVIFAQGRPDPADSMETPAGTTLWEFVANDQRSGKSWDMSYSDMLGWAVVERPAPPANLVNADLSQIGLDVNTAWILVGLEDLDRPFISWTLAAEDGLAPRFAFNFSDGTVVMVDTETGIVYGPLGSEGSQRDEWDCLTECRIGYLRCEDYCRKEHPGESWCYDGCDASRQECDNCCFSGC